MPTYDLTCEDCGERTERFFTRLLRDEDKVCSCCGSRAVRTGVGGGVLGLRASSPSSDGGGCGASGFA